MGIDVDNNKRVTHNADHEQRVVTSIARNPHTIDDNGLLITSIFRRRHAGKNESDGNQLIYALKRKFGYTIGYNDIKEINRLFSLILATALNEKQFDVIVPMPSSASVARIMADRIKRSLGGNTVVLHAFRKATVQEVLSAAVPVGSVHKRLRNDYGKTLGALQSKKGGQSFEMKLVEQSVRHLFSPIVIDPGMGAMISGQRIVIVDDIVSSGTTLRSAALSIQHAGAMSVEAYCLLGKVGH